jgi:uncharacterized membrane protein YuzA (DUF378 family)
MNETMWNVTNSSMTMDSSGMLPLLLILLMGTILIGALGFALSNLEKYKKLWAILGAMVTSIIYFAYGLCVVVPMVLLYIGGYAGITCIGYLVKRAIDRATKLHGEMKESEKDGNNQHN